jgi:YHS domain-containing protein
VCGEPLRKGVLRLRYENRTYAFDRERCKRIFQENPDRFLDADGEVLEHPR